jgi:hypothetical protein
MSQAQVRDWFGEPDEAGEEVNGTECWYYEEGVPGAGLNTYQFCFENGLLTRKNSDY